MSEHHHETYQFEVVESRESAREEGSLSAAEEAVDVTFVLGVDDGHDRVLQQLRYAAHVPAVVRRLVEPSAERLVRHGLSPCEMTHHVQRVLRLQVVGDHLAVHADVDHVEGVKPVLVLDVDLLVDVLQGEDHAGLVALHDRVDAKRHVVDVPVFLPVGD